ncbi:MAG: ComF family protein [Actinomycetota bacterium]|nr:ComF family protein [Actinomycetota bacterium]
MYEPYLSALVDLFYPERCVGCERRASDVLCRTCFEALPGVGSPVCRRCGLPSAFAAFVCEECKNVDFGFESAKAPLKYEGVGKKIVHALKYRGYKRVVERLATPLMLQVLDDGRFDAIVPVPLHRLRLRKRGFNQAELLARGVAEKIKATVSDTLEVVRSTRDQVELSAAQRRANVAGAYTATVPLRGRILLIDDVFTTGATMSACAGTLVSAGAEEVHALSLCRTC